MLYQGGGRRFEKYGRINIQPFIAFLNSETFFFRSLNDQIFLSVPLDFWEALRTGK